jgi:hypothetical protein
LVVTKTIVVLSVVTAGARTFEHHPWRLAAIAAVTAVDTALWLAVGVGVATLTIQGVRYALLERLNPVATMVTSPPTSRSVS